MGDAEHLIEAATKLWPEPATVQLARRGDPVPQGASVLREFVFVPHARRPRLLLPSSAPVAAAAVRRFSHDLPISERIRRSAIAIAVRSGAPDRVLADRLRIVATDPGAVDSVEKTLAELLGRDVRISLGVGSARANRKPILQVFTPDGKDVAFVKVGDSDMSRELVTAEAAALRTLGERTFTRLQIPRLIALHRWRELELLVISTLPTQARRYKPAADVPHAAMSELATSGGVSISTVTGAPFWAALADTIGRIDAGGADGPVGALRRLCDAVAERHGDTVITVGAWHGDWAPWNMAWHRDIVRVWDWERFAEGVPIGLDALHYLLRVSLRDLSDQDSAARALEAGTASALTALGIPAAAHEATLHCYLLELAARYTEAAQGPIGAPLLPRAQWVRELLAHTLGVS